MKDEDARMAPSWEVAGGYLTPFSQQRIGSVADFIAAGTAYNNVGQDLRLIHSNKCSILTISWRPSLRM